MAKLWFVKMATPQKHEYFYMPLVTLDNHMVWGESSLKMSALWLKGFGIYDVLKIWRKRMTDLINQSINQLMTKVFVEQPRLNQVC